MPGRSGLEKEGNEGLTPPPALCSRAWDRQIGRHGETKTAACVSIARLHSVEAKGAAAQGLYQRKELWQ